MDDVAARSGVARATVSRVLNDGPNVSAKMRTRVLAAVDALDYQVNVQARFLAGGANRTVLLICSSNVESEPNSYYQSALEIGALRAAVPFGFDIVTHAIVDTASDCEARILELVEDSRCTGIILTPPFSDRTTLTAALAKRACALVCISPALDVATGAPSVRMDDEAAGFALARHLLALGHRRFGFIKGLAGHLSAEERHDGALRALVAEGLGPEAMISCRGDFTFKAGVDLLPTLIAADPRPTAIICANDDTAVGALFAAHRDGLSVPGDLSIGSFDDTPVSALVWPPLTTIHQPIQAMSGRAIQIIAAIQKGATAVTTGPEMLPFHLVERASTALPPDR
ncbi:LacI family DNA-binding transcriptional regulator [Sphingomonas sp. Ant20]|uniref:LacI family DNA-binding transcriptional regulator n=1 Tax=Sphingomonas sp. Ant20 TaxID=104605 RepID=UPI00274239A7|nr:LacI family DNA-binding transcriptional regulator [Sphingomonas sp. Ant20]